MEGVRVGEEEEEEEEEVKRDVRRVRGEGRGLVVVDILGIDGWKVEWGDGGTCVGD